MLWDIEVWYDPPAAPMRLSTLPYEEQPLLMTFPGYVVPQRRVLMVVLRTTTLMLHLLLPKD